MKDNPTTKATPIIALYRFAHKRDGRLTGGIVYRVKASDWTSQNRHTYDVTLYRGKSSSCTCAARGDCKHRQFCEDREQQRREHAPLNGNKPFNLLRAS